MWLRLFALAGYSPYAPFRSNKAHQHVNGGPSIMCHLIVLLDERYILAVAVVPHQVFKSLVQARVLLTASDVQKLRLCCTTWPSVSTTSELPLHTTKRWSESAERKWRGGNWVDSVRMLQGVLCMDTSARIRSRARMPREYPDVWTMVPEVLR